MDYNLLKFLSLGLLVSSALWPNCDAANILAIFPHHGYSHFKVFYPILRGLAERQHNVTVITYVKSPESHDNYEEWLLEGKDTKEIFTLDRFWATRNFYTMWKEFFALYYEGQRSCEHFYQSGFVEKIVSRHNKMPYDLVITELFNTDCQLGVAHLLKLPVIGLSSCALMPWYYDRIALPDTPSYVQSEFVGFPEPLSMWARFINFVQSRANKFLYGYYTTFADNEIIKKYLNVTVDMESFVKTNTSLILSNQHYSLMGNRPTTAQLIEISGIHIDENRIDATLPTEIANFLEGPAPELGVLFISWGSMLRFSSMGSGELDIILRTLQKLPIKVIWKWESDKLPIESDKILFVRWAPQLTLLCHPKVTAFWGHGGNLGTTEAVYCGKPAILTPIYGDQFHNAYAVSNRRVGMVLDYYELHLLESSIRQIMDPSYTKRAQKLSHIFRNRQIAPLENALWWIEHLLHNGDIAHELLKTPAVHLYWTTYYSLDVIFVFLFLLYHILMLIRDQVQHCRQKYWGPFRDLWTSRIQLIKRYITICMIFCFGGLFFLLFD